ncbi:MAG: DUF4175 family protein, partial [bacterium]
MADQNSYHALVRRLKAFRTRLKLLFFAEKVLFFLSIAFLIGTVLPIVYIVGQGDNIFRWLITTSTFAAGIYLGYRFVLQPLLSLVIYRNSPTLDKTALQIGQWIPKIKDKLSNAYQLIRQMPEMHGESKTLAWAAFDSIHRSTENVNFNASIDATKTKRNFGWFVVVLILFVGAYILFPANYSKALTLLFNPATKPEAAVLQFTVTPGEVEVVRGEDLDIELNIQNAIIDAAQIVTEFKEGDFSELNAMASIGRNKFTHKFENITEAFSYYINLENKRSEKYDVTVIDLPDVRELQVTLKYPVYSQMQLLRLDPNVGNINALRGTVVELSVMPNKQIASAAAIFASGDTLQMEKSSELYETRFPITGEDSYFISLRDNKDLANKHPIVYQITTVPDQNPVVEITFPGKDIDIDESMEMPVVIEGEDDFGFSKLQIAYEIIPGGAETQSQKGMIDVQFQAHEGKLQARTVWDLMPLMLLPDDAVEYHAVLYDNDNVTGPKPAHSKKYRLRFPSMREIFNQTADQQEEAVESFEEMVERTKEVKENVDEMVREMLRQQELDWEDKQQLKENLESQKDVFDKLQEAQNKLEEMVDRLERNDLLSMETLQKYQELQDLLEEIATPELKKMLDKLNSAMENIDPKQIRKALEELQASQDEFLKSLEKTINLLKQLQAEQRLEEAIKTVEEMQQRQDQVNQETAQTPDSSSLSKLSQKEMQQQQSLSDLQKALKDLHSRMGELPNMKMSEESIRKAQEMAADNAEMQSEMRRMLQQLRRGQQQQAQQSGQNVSQSLQKMYDTLSQAQQQMQQQQQSQAMQALQRGSRDLLQLSKKQEQLRQQSGNRSQATTDHRKMADDQQNLLSGMQRVVNQLFETSQNSFFVPPEIARELGKSMQGMQGAINELESQQGRNASNKQGQAMQGLNGAVAELRKAMQAMNQGGGSGSGMEQLMQRLAGVSGEQQGINQQTQGLGNQGQLSMQQQAGLARLAAQQEALKKTLQELAQELGGQNEILGSMDKIAQDMGDVAQDLARQNISRQTLERQRRILSRLLDAQRSAQQRDVSKKRRAETGKQYTSIDPGFLPPDLGEAQTKIQQDLLKALRENYSKDYKIL